MSNWIESMQRLGASVEELANETREDLLGYEGKEQGEGHKPPRADIAKMQEVYDLWQQARYKTDSEGLDVTDLAAEKEWKSKYSLSSAEYDIVKNYMHWLGEIRDPFVGWDPEYAFAMSVDFLKNKSGVFIDGRKMNDNEAKGLVGNALKKYEQQNYPILYQAVKKALDDAYRRNTESYKLWPRMVTWIKEEFQKTLKGGDLLNQVGMEPNRINALNHVVDIVVEGGPIVNQLRRENQWPANLDINKMQFHEFENWLMQWKRDNREQESQGEVVYEWPDGYTMQRLTSPEQLQFEGDEMGHCVGGYSNAVDNDDSLIYSLRDKKGTPHVTMEIEGWDNVYTPLSDKTIDEMSAEEITELTGKEDGMRNMRDISFIPKLDDPQDRKHYEQLQREMNEKVLRSIYSPTIMQKVKPIPHEFDSEQSYYGSTGRPVEEPTFEVHQIMGNSNQTPIPAYQTKVKEFLSFLSSEKGIKFKRSDEWFSAYDQPYGDDDNYFRNPGELEEWYDAYCGQPDRWKGKGIDDYGMEMPIPYMSVDFGDIIEETVKALVNDGDYHRWSTRDWAGSAQRIYHAWMLELESGTNAVMAKDWETKQEKSKKILLDLISNAESNIWDWEGESSWYWLDGAGDQIKENYLELGGQLDEEGNMLDQDLQIEAEQKITDAESEYVFGNCQKFLNYLYNLVEHAGIVHANELPSPSDRNGGLPDYESLIELNSRVEIPGALT